jgi:hypothetical protein
VVCKTDKHFEGNSILVHLAKIGEKNYYLFVGDTVVEFEIDDTIVEYYSQVGNSDVPYPVAVGKNYVYFMLDFVAQPIEKYRSLSAEQMVDAYSYFYGHSCYICHKSRNQCECTKQEFENLKYDYSDV